MLNVFLLCVISCGWTGGEPPSKDEKVSDDPAVSCHASVSIQKPRVQQTLHMKIGTKQCQD